MSTVIRDPIREFEALFRRNPEVPESRVRRGGEIARWRPIADVHETEHEYLITAELPDVRREDVKVTFEHGLITVSGERREQKSSKGGRGIRVERLFGSFSRSFCLPDDVDPAGIRAESRDGVLRVHVPKTKDAPAKGVTIPVS